MGKPSKKSIKRFQDKQEKRQLKKEAEQKAASYMPPCEINRKALGILRHEQKKAFIASYKTECRVCGETEAACLDFHHKDPSQKEANISSLLGCKDSYILAEIRKCIVLCANCHRKVHAGLLEISLEKSPLNDVFTV